MEDRNFKCACHGVNLNSGGRKVVSPTAAPPAANTTPSPGERCSPGQRAGGTMPRSRLTSWHGREFPNRLGRAGEREDVPAAIPRGAELRGDPFGDVPPPPRSQATARRGGQPANAPSRGQGGGNEADGGCCGVTQRAGARAGAGALPPARSGNAGIKRAFHRSAPKQRLGLGARRLHRRASTQV